MADQLLFEAESERLGQDRQHVEEALLAEGSRAPTYFDRRVNLLLGHSSDLLLSLPAGIFLFAFTGPLGLFAAPYPHIFYLILLADCRGIHSGEVIL